MIGISEVEKIHDILIEKFGGVKGTRDRGLLQSAINRPYQTFDGQLTFDEIRSWITKNLK